MQPARRSNPSKRRRAKPNGGVQPKDKPGHKKQEQQPTEEHGFLIERSDVLFVAAAITAAVWVVGTLAGGHPDGALLGFSGTMWAVWVTSEREARQSRERAKRREDDS